MAPGRYILRLIAILGRLCVRGLFKVPKVKREPDTHLPARVRKKSKREGAGRAILIRTSDRQQLRLGPKRGMWTG